ncbi:MAG: helix-turn-helix domain-containing protein [Bacteroides sp.]|nr:helix-turn-helix domain-containing protein [Bacteroides sp.]
MKSIKTPLLSYSNRDICPESISLPALQPIITGREKDLPGDRSQRELFLRLREYLVKDKNFTKTSIDTSRLVTTLSTNRTYLFEAVKSVAGKTLQEYINCLRLEEGRKLLETTDELIESIAAVCGYNSVRTFYRLFRSTYEMSPAVYRKMVKSVK